MSGRPPQAVQVKNGRLFGKLAVQKTARCLAAKDCGGGGGGVLKKNQVGVAAEY